MGIRFGVGVVGRVGSINSKIGSFPVAHSILPSIAAVKAVAVKVWHRASLRPMEELHLISLMAVLFIHNFFVCLVPLPESWVLNPFNLLYDKV